jgi:chaperone modulatory protein CbpM
MRMDEIISSIAELRRKDLETWMREALIELDEHEGEQVLSDVACARVRLICTLHYDMDIEANAIPVILDLIDQLHETRGCLNAMSRAVLVQDSKIRDAVLTQVRGNGET